MIGDRYEISSNKENLKFEFVSTGPKGEFKKVIEFIPQHSNDTVYFSLSFGDWNDTIKDIDDRVVTNNSDSKKVLAAVAAAVLMFTQICPNMGVYAQGSTLSRTRLYQMGICANWSEIGQVFYVYGKLNDIWYAFQKNVNDEAFFVARK